MINNRRPVIRHRPGVNPPVTYIGSNETTSPKFGQAFMHGCGGRAHNSAYGLIDGDVCSFGTPPTWPLFDQAIREGRNWYYGDHAYYRRGKYYRVTKNAYQYQPTADEIQRATPERFTACPMTAEPDWRDGGATVVICPNSEPYMARHGVNAKEWAVDCARQVAQHTDRSIVVRWKAQVGRRPFYLDLHEAFAVVVYNSNAAVEALAAGVPVFVTCPWASTFSMGLNDLALIESPYRPDNRLEFLWTLANHQWSLDEISRGLAWKTLQA